MPVTYIGSLFPGILIYNCKISEVQGERKSRSPDLSGTYKALTDYLETTATKLPISSPLADNQNRWQRQPDNLVMLCKFKSLSLFISLEIDSSYGL